MNSIIICEGETDFVFLQHYMEKVNGWNDSKQKPNPSFISSVDNSRSRDFIKNADTLTIISEATEKVPITAFLSIFSVTLFKNYRKRTLKILRSEVFQWPHHFLWWMRKYKKCI